MKCVVFGFLPLVGWVQLMMPGRASLNKNPHRLSLSGQTVAPRGVALFQAEYFWHYLPWSPGLYGEEHLFKPCCAVLSCFSHVQFFVTPMDHSPPGSSVHGILQPRTLEWVAISSSRGSSRPREGTHIPYVSCVGRQGLYHWRHLGSPADKKNVLNLFSLSSRWKWGIERKTAGGREGREKSEVKFFWWEMSMHREPGGSNPHGRRYQKAVQASFFCPKSFFSFFFFLRAFNFLSLPFPFICQLWVFWFDSRETDSWWSPHCFNNTRLFMFTLSLRRRELVFRKAASCSQSLCFGAWAMVEMNFSEFKVKLVSPQIGEPCVPVVKRVCCR